jgi:hypothetical protein
MQTHALVLQRQENRRAQTGDADHLTMLQTMISQYFTLYLTWLSVKQNNSSSSSFSSSSSSFSTYYRRPSWPMLLWFAVGFSFPFIGILVYPTHHYLTPLFMYFGTVGSTIICVRQLERMGPLRNEWGRGSARV